MPETRYDDLIARDHHGAGQLSFEHCTQGVTAVQGDRVPGASPGRHRPSHVPARVVWQGEPMPACGGDLSASRREFGER